jgi:hypothetical protein
VYRGIYGTNFAAIGKETLGHGLFIYSPLPATATADFGAFSNKVSTQNNNSVTNSPFLWVFLLYKTKLRPNRWNVDQNEMVLERETPSKNNKGIEMRRRRGRSMKRANGTPRGKERKNVRK